MPWLGIWFDPRASEGEERSPEWFRGLEEPVVYPYVHGFIEAEEKRLKRSSDPGSYRKNDETFRVYYSLQHQGGRSEPEEQGCRILEWLFENFEPGRADSISSRFSEIPVVIHAREPVKAAALGNALTLLRFLGAREDQAIAKMMIWPWDPRQGSVRLAAERYEDRVIEFLNGELYYPETVDVFDVLDRQDLRSQRGLPSCCAKRLAFMEPLLQWIDEEWPKTPEERSKLAEALGKSIIDEAQYIRARRPPPPPKSAMESFR